MYKRQNLATPPTNYSNVPLPEEEEEGLAAAEASLPTKENDEGDMVSMPEPLLEGLRGVETGLLRPASGYGQVLPCPRPRY